MRGPLKKKQDMDAFINNELEDPKPVFAVKKPNAFAKPTFGLSAQKKPIMFGASSDHDQDIEQSTDLPAYPQMQSNTFESPTKPAYEPQRAYEPEARATPVIARTSEATKMKVKASVGPAIFMKPNLPSKKKFQMDAPSAEEQQKFDKLIVQEVKRADLQNMQRDNSVSKIKVNETLVAPKALVQKTQEQLAYQKFNPRPPSTKLNKTAVVEDEYEVDQEDGFEEEDEDDEARLNQIKKAMLKENAQAVKVTSKLGPVASKPQFSQVKQGPISAADRKPSSHLVTRAQEDDIPDQSNFQKRNVVLPQSNITRFNQAAPIANQSQPVVVQQPIPTQKQPQQKLASVKQPLPTVQTVQQPLATVQSIQQTFIDPVQPKKQVQQENLEGFAKQSALIGGSRVDHQAANLQLARASELRDLIQLEQEEFFNVFELLPQTSMDIYFNKLSAGILKTAVTSCAEDMVDRDIQTEDLGMEHKAQQAPEDQMISDYQPKQAQQRFKRAAAKNEALQLEKFMSKACPALEQICEENDQLRFIDNRTAAAARNAVEPKSSLKFPQELLVMLGTKKSSATIERVSCIHVFETMPQSKCAIAYEVQSPRHNDVIFVVVVYSTTANQALRILWAESEVTQMCTPADDQILIIGTAVGSICLYDLADFESAVKRDFLDYKLLIAVSQPELFSEDEPLKLQLAVKSISNKYTVLAQTFQTDVLPSYMHFSAIRRLKFVSKVGSSPAQIGAMDELGVVSSWSVMEIQEHVANKIGDFDLNLCIGGRFKLLENYSVNLQFIPGLLDDITQTLDLEFDPNDQNIFYFSTSKALYKCNRRESGDPVRMQTDGLGAPTVLSMSDSQYLLVGFSCGSIALYHNSYSAPVTVWYQACKYPITELKWCLLYFNPESQTSSSDRKFMSRLCEFFVMDKSEHFYIYNLSKNLNRPVHVINFAQKHASMERSDLYQISMTCADQTFFTPFLVRDHAVQLYMMNFKKGSQITKEKLAKENAMSYNLLRVLPLSPEKDDQVIDL